jgi:hypothetical protein
LVALVLALAAGCGGRGSGALDVGEVTNRRGPLAWLDRRGAGTAVADLERLTTRHGARFAPSEMLMRMAREGARFYPD